MSRAARCTCSLCRMRGAVVVFVALDRLAVTAGAERLTEYRFHSNTARHYFCSRCGVYTHHQRRFDPDQFAVNVACLEGVSPFDFAEVPVIDGANHPRDTGGGELRQIGVVRFEPRSRSETQFR
ncbi:MAG: GFA family protein [Novosphingobium sp.]|nr:GFA family protein [Novosphingobium sp.]